MLGMYRVASCRNLHFNAARKALRSERLERREVNSASVVGEVLAGKQGVIEAELGEVSNAAGIQDAIEVIDFMLYDARMKVLDGAVDGRPGGIEAGVAQIPIPRYQPAHAGDRQAPLPALVLLLAERGQGGGDQHGVRHGLGLRDAG